MFAALRREIISRSFSLERHFKEQVASLSPPAVITAKGIAFVQMYAIHEFTLLGAVAAALNATGNHGLQVAEIRRELAALVLTPELQSYQTCGKEKLWNRNVELLMKSASSDIAIMPADAFPHNGSQYRRSQIETIWLVFGISVPIVPDPRILPLIDEVVGNRNAIAHGRITAEDIGQTYSHGQIETKMFQIRDLCLYVAATLEAHCTAVVNVRKPP